MSENERRQEPESAEEWDKVLPGYLGESPPYGSPPVRGERVWVDRPEQLQHAANVLRHAPVIAIDAEFTQVRALIRAQGEMPTSTHRLALLQLAIDGRCFVVDALRLRDLSPLAAVVGNPEIRILLHGAGADLRVMSERELFVAYYFDLEAASRSIFGQHESSLAAMLLRAFQVRLDKSLQRTDWTRRPLPPAMVAYAARDAEMTLALYYWLFEYFPWALNLHDSANLQTPVASWIEPFLRGISPVPPDVAIAEAIEQGVILSRQQVVNDCRNALTTLIHPMQRSRLLRLIADLALTQLTPDIEPLLQALTSDERAAAIRALIRLDAEHSKEKIYPLLQDPVHDVRKAASTALRSNVQRDITGPGLATPAKSADGSRSWTVGETGDAGGADDNDWKARLRSMMGEEPSRQPRTDPDQQ